MADAPGVFRDVVPALSSEHEHEIRRRMWSTVTSVVPYPALCGSDYDRVADALTEVVGQILARQRQHLERSHDVLSDRIIEDRNQLREDLGRLRKLVTEQLDSWDAVGEPAANDLRSQLGDALGGPQ